MSKNRTKRGGKLKWIIIAIVALAIIGAVAGGDDSNNPDSSEKTITPTDSEHLLSTESELPSETTTTEAGSNLLSEAEIIESDVYNGTGDTILGKSGCIQASGYDISYSQTPDFEILCTKIESLKDEYMWFTIDFCDGTGIVFTGCDILMPVSFVCKFCLRISSGNPLLLPVSVRYT